MTYRDLLLGLILVGAGFVVAPGAAAQGPETPPQDEKGFVVYEAFEGSSNSEGQVLRLDSSAIYNFNRHFAAGGGIPVYFDHTSSSTAGTTSSSGIGNFYALVAGKWKNSTLNYGTSLLGTAPSGDTKKGLSTGHATFDWNNRVDHDFGPFTPFADAGIANSVADTRFFQRPFTTYGTLGHFEAGADVDLSHHVSLTLSAYDIAPWGHQTLISRLVKSGAAGSGGGHGRAFETAHQTTGSASLTRDNGFTAGVGFSPTRYLDFALGYTRSVHYALNTVSFGVGVNVSRLFREARKSGS